MLTFKRIIDFWASMFGLFILLPSFLAIAIAIKVESRGSVFFRQERVGKGGRMFKIFKFRTLVVNAEKMGAGVFVEREDPRITRVGKWLRNTSIDELPQLINVLRGEMSLVGPRPTLPYQVERYNERQRRRLLMCPGMTGWAQINGRNRLTWPEKIELDIWYVENWSLWLDLKILIRTISILFQRDNLYLPSTEGDEISRFQKDKGVPL